MELILCWSKQEQREQEKKVEKAEVLPQKQNIGQNSPRTNVIPPIERETDFRTEAFKHIHISLCLGGKKKRSDLWCGNRKTPVLLFLHYPKRHQGRFDLSSLFQMKERAQNFKWLFIPLSPPTSFKSGFIWNKYQLAQYQPLNSYSLQDHFPCYHVNEPPWSSPALLYIMVVLLLNTVKAVQASITTHRWIKYTVHLVKQWLLKVYSPPYLYIFRFEVLWRRM